MINKENMSQGRMDHSCLVSQGCGQAAREAFTEEKCLELQLKNY